MKFNELVGNTPIVRLENLGVKSSVKLFAKLEGNNPGGSVKDRAAFGMIKGAIDRGEVLKEVNWSKRLVEIRGLH